MKVNISYKDSLTFEQFKEQFGQYFMSVTPSKKESEMKKIWEKAENNIKNKTDEIQTVEYNPSPEAQTYTGDDDDDLEDADDPDKDDVPKT